MLNICFTIVINADKYYAVSDDAKIEALDSYEGKQNVIKWESAAGSVSYEVDVPADAFYSVKFSYYPIAGSGNKINIGLQVDDGFPYTDLTSFSLNRTYNSSEGIKQDTAGNDYNTTQVELFDWNEKFAVSDSGVSDQPFLIYLTKGKHSLVVYSFNEPFVLGDITLCTPSKHMTYKEYIAKYGQIKDGEWGQKIEAEDTFKKSEQNMVASTDRTSTKNSPFNYTKTVLNVIGGSTWSYAGQWLEWQVEGPEDGYYEIF